MAEVEVYHGASRFTIAGNVPYVTTSSRQDSSAFAAPLGRQFQLFLDEHRAFIRNSLEGLTEAEVRTRLVPSGTTLLGLVKHAAFVEQVWFNEAITCRSREDIGCPPGPDESFRLSSADTIQSVQDAHRRICEESRAVSDPLGLDDVVTGNRRGPLPMRWIYLHVLRELAQHCGHADILREQILAVRSMPPGTLPVPSATTGSTR